jgi:DNA-binding transcriptional LysR family regulator
MEELKRLGRITEFWNWLPAFRAVAETEHMGRAADKVFKSASSLSRSVSLLEENLGIALFEKDGRQIKLTEAGRTFLKILRRSMRLIDEGVQVVSEQTVQRTFYVTVADWMAWVLDQSAPDLVASVAETKLDFVTTSAPKPSQRLLTGQVDLLLTHVPVTREGLDTHNIATVKHAVYAGVSHSLIADELVLPEALAEYEFVGPSQATGSDVVDEWPRDGWPREFDRDVRCTVDQPLVAGRIAASTDLLCVLPVRLVEATDQLAKSLRQIPTQFLLETPVFCVRREQLIDEDLNQQIIEKLAKFQY